MIHTIHHSRCASFFMTSFNLPNRPPQPMASFNHPPPPKAPPLAPGWTEHKAPTGKCLHACTASNRVNVGYLTSFTGHPYYYNAATKTSTYTRPAATAPAPFAADPAPGSYPTYAPAHGPHGGGLPPRQFSNQQQFTPQQQSGYGQSRGRGGMGRGGRFNNQNLRLQHQKRQEKPDRPKLKYQHHLCLNEI